MSDQIKTKKRGGGPKTLEGKERVRYNALRHGLSSELLVLDTEDPEEFATLEREYYNQFRPVDFLERELVDTMVKARWRLLRYLRCEKNAVDQETARISHYNSLLRLQRTPVDIATDGVYRVTKRHSLAQSRYEAQFERSYYRALNKLTELRSRQKHLGLRPPQNIPVPLSEPVISAASGPNPVDADESVVMRDNAPAKLQNKLDPTRLAPPHKTTGNDPAPFPPHISRSNRGIDPREPHHPRERSVPS